MGKTRADAGKAPEAMRWLRWRVALIVVGLNLLIALLIASFLGDYAATQRQHAWTNAENLNRALDEGLEGRFSQIDIVLQSVADEHRRELAAGGIDAAALQDILDRQARRLPDTIGLRVTDAQGDMLWASNQPRPNGVNVLDREYFQAVRDDPNGGMVVSKPEFGRLANMWISIFARRLSAPDGSFAGEVHASIPTQRLEQIFATLDVGRHGVVSLWNDAPATVARFPQVAKPGGVIALAPSPSPELRELFRSGQTKAAYRATSGTDQVARTYFFRRMKSYPLSLIVGLADVDYGADWKAIAVRFATLYGLLFAASVVGGVMIYLRAAAQAHAKGQERLAASVYDNSSEGMAILDADRRVVDVNASFVALTGFDADEVRGRRVSRLFPSTRDVGVVAGVARALIEARHWSGEMWLSRKDSGSFLARVSVSAIDGSGAERAKYVVLFSDATEQKRAQETIWRHANFDIVTQLPNRRQFCERLRSEIRKAESVGAEIAVIFIDLDRFKDVNDRFGHAVGDLLLLQAAERIRSCVRVDDVVARLGGDEFTIMLPNFGENNALERVTADVVSALARPYALSGGQCFSSASLGVTLYPRDGADVETLLRNADQAMYSAKQGGRNRFAYFAPSLQILTSARARLASDLHCALANGELELYYQPIVETSSGRVVKAEALARWRHPRLGMVSPVEFIPIAEETGLIIDIGDWAFRTAAAQAKAWRRAYDPAFQISVNVSAVQLLAPDGAAANFGRILQQPGLGPGSMIIEITESVLIDASETVRRLFTRYRAAGIEIALDDFGTGYSSLAYLKDFEINYLKVDRAFVSTLAARSRDYAICEAIVAMAHKLGVRVVAEGVETAAQRDLLAGAQCDFAQGYLFARPLPVDEFEAKVFAERLRAAS